jgi:hypothetical protein
MMKTNTLFFDSKLRYRSLTKNPINRRSIRVQKKGFLKGDLSEEKTDILPMPIQLTTLRQLRNYRNYGDRIHMNYGDRIHIAAFFAPLVLGNIGTDRPVPMCPVSHALLAMTTLSKASLPARNATFHGFNMPNCDPGGKAECVVALMTHPSVQRARCAHD